MEVLFVNFAGGERESLAAQVFEQLSLAAGPPKKASGQNSRQ
jgi:hypothetical protein